ncbi:trigger factor [Pseudoramibacter sp.]|jgi:trigger factor|uniref:trigger factor n=1 Tax=Pseudoramibacter sp. TaxID=2034862 RepID=UPI0025EF7DB4|nr:trigger factor [Pseudoramibacter sp.]MCH4072759.1 trigger factor [Pseudoramibacter sp.]MCH4106530.1 trigger factor [Pseudoramibacter sp.]
MTAKILENEKNVVKLEMSIPKDKFQEAMDQSYKKNKKYFTIQGFRKGKAPRKVIEAHYGKEVFLEDAIEFAFPETYQEAIKEIDIEPVSRPSLEKVEDVGDEGATFVVKVAVKPEVKLGEYKGAEIPVLEEPVSDEDVEKRLEQMQNQNSRLVTDDKEAAQKGDTVVIDYEGSIDGEPFEGGKDDGYSLELGSNTFIPGFEDQLVGVKAGEDKDVNVTFPEDYHAEDLKGKDALFKVHVVEVQRKELPAIDDEFAKDVSEFDTLDELKEDLKKKIAEEKKEAKLNTARQKALDYAIENAEMDIPEMMIDEEVDRDYENLKRQMSGQGLSMENYFKFTGQSKEVFRKSMAPDAEKNIKADLVLEAIGKAENIEPSEEEIDDEIKEYAHAFNQEFDKYKESLDDQMLEYITDTIKRRKALDLLVDSGKQVEDTEDKSADEEKED